MSPEEYLHTIARKSFGVSGAPIIYYPGAGEDSGPIEMFLSSSDEGLIAVYADYHVQHEEIDRLIRKLTKYNRAECPKITELTPGDFGVKSARSFWPTRTGCTEYEWERLQFETTLMSGDELFGMRFFFRQLHLTLIYLKTEAIQTLKVLQKNNLFPDLIVLEDPNYGGEWTPFGGDSKLFKAAKHKPKFIYVSHNTQPWPGYVPVTDGRIDSASCHRQERVIYSLRID